MKKLYVGNLPYSYDENSLRDLFADYGEVFSAAIIMDRATNRSKGFGFVELNDAEADRAIAELHGKEQDGRALVVSEARPMAERPQRSSRDFGNRNGGGHDRRSRY